MLHKTTVKLAVHAAGILADRSPPRDEDVRPPPRGDVCLAGSRTSADAVLPAGQGGAGHDRAVAAGALARAGPAGAAEDLEPQADVPRRRRAVVRGAGDRGPSGPPGMGRGVGLGVLERAADAMAPCPGAPDDRRGRSARPIGPPGSSTGCGPPTAAGWAASSTCSPGGSRARSDSPTPRAAVTGSRPRSAGSWPPPCNSTTWLSSRSSRYAPASNRHSEPATRSARKTAAARYSMSRPEERCPALEFVSAGEEARGGPEIVSNPTDN